MVKVPEGYRSQNVRDTRTSGGTSSSRSTARTRGGSDLLGSMIGGNAMGGSLLGSLAGPVLSGILGSMMGGGGQSSGGGLGGLLGSMLGGGASRQQMTDAEQNDADDQATLLLRAMINATKADGKLERDEVEAITSRLGEIDANEKAFLEHEFAQPVNIAEFARTVPEEMAQQVYAFSLLGIKVDTNREAQYLRTLAGHLGLSDRVVDQIHQKFNEPDITG